MTGKEYHYISQTIESLESRSKGERRRASNDQLSTEDKHHLTGVADGMEIACREIRNMLHTLNQ
jgi:hypothetical protein